MIDKIRNNGNVNWYDDDNKRVHQRKRIRRRLRKDEIKINNKAESEIINKIKKESDTRKDKIEEVRKRISEGYYNNKKITEELANILLGKTDQ